MSGAAEEGEALPTAGRSYWLATHSYRVPDKEVTFLRYPDR